MAAGIFARLGTVPAHSDPLLEQRPLPGERLGHEARPDHGPRAGVLSGLDHAVTHPQATGHLHRALADAGYLPDQPDDPQPRGGPGWRRNRVQRVRADQLRRTAASRSNTRQTPQRTQNRPEPAPQPGHDYSPQPGRLDPDPGHQYRLRP